MDMMIPPIPYDSICWHYDFGVLDDWDLPLRNIFVRTRNDYDPYRVVPDRLYITTSGKTIRVTNEDTVAHRFQSTASSTFGLLDSTGGFAALDTAVLDPGEEGQHPASIGLEVYGVSFS